MNGLIFWLHMRLAKRFKRCSEIHTGMAERRAKARKARHSRRAQGR